MSFSYFYPRSPCGERHFLRKQYALAFQISIHALLAESDSLRVGDVQTSYHFYPRSPCGERRWISYALLDAFGISIHALLAESDEPQRAMNLWIEVFLSTLSLRRATFSLALYSPLPANFYPRSPCGERRFHLCCC